MGYLRSVTLRSRSLLATFDNDSATLVRHLMYCGDEPAVAASSPNGPGTRFSFAGVNLMLDGQSTSEGPGSPFVPGSIHTVLEC